MHDTNSIERCNGLVDETTTMHRNREVGVGDKLYHRVCKRCVKVRQIIIINLVVKRVTCTQRRTGNGGVLAFATWTACSGLLRAAWSKKEKARGKGNKRKPKRKEKV